MAVWSPVLLAHSTHLSKLIFSGQAQVTLQRLKQCCAGEMDQFCNAISLAHMLRCMKSLVGDCDRELAVGQSHARRCRHGGGRRPTGLVRRQVEEP